ncbi:ribonuclease H-like domain-containing protein [Candidatus Berkelbacteria bacterium]|nr:ribonuclease H-like domain-containing protein [Candidatus Berkelbacteria bacterium]
MITFLDIETIPANQDKFSQLNKIYRRKRQETSFNSFHRSTSLNGNWGQIICIGLALDTNRAQICTGSEQEILVNFWQLIKDSRLLVGHNIIGFDLPFIFKRSVVNNIEPTLKIDLKNKSSIFDTMREWDGWSNSYTGLDQLASILGFKSSKNGIDGSKVWQYHQAGRDEEIYNYCLADVELTRKIYYRLTFNQDLEKVQDYYLEPNQTMQFK